MVAVSAGPSTSLFVSGQPAGAGAGVLNLYWDPVAGSDLNAGNSTAAPVRTATRLMQLLPRVLRSPVLVHTTEGDLNFSAAPVPSLAGAERMLCFYADFAWDPRGLLVDVVLTGAAAAGTNGNTCVLPAPATLNQYESFSLRYTTGAAANGQVRSVAQHPTTALTPSAAFNPAPAPGDTFQVFRSRALLDTAQRVAFDNPGNTSFMTDDAEAGLSFVNIGVAAVAGFSKVFGPGFVLGYGFRLEGSTSLTMHGAALFGVTATAGVGVLARQFGLPQHLWAGWGLMSDTLNVQPLFGTSSFRGYVVTLGSFGAQNGTIWTAQGGSARSISAFTKNAYLSLAGPTGLPFQFGSDVAANSVVNFAGIGSGTIVLGSNCVLRHAADGTTAMLLQGPGLMTISTTVTGSNPGTGNTMNISKGFQVQTAGALALGRAAADPSPNDLIVESLAAINKTALTAAGATSIRQDPTFPGAYLRRMA